MKKIIPLIFAVLPIMSAMADIPLFETQEGQVASSTTIASTSYVDGAYNALGTAINGVIDTNATLTSTKQAKSDSTVAADGNYIVQGTGVGTNLVNLDNAVGKVANNNGNYVKATDTSNNNAPVSVAQNLLALDAQVKTVTDKVGTIPVGESGNTTAQIWLTTTPSE